MLDAEARIITAQPPGPAMHSGVAQSSLCALLLPHIDEMVTDGLVTLEKVQVIKYRADPPGGSASCATISKSPHPPSDQATPVSTDGLAPALVALLLSRAVQPRSYRRSLERGRMLRWRSVGLTQPRPSGLALPYRPFDGPGACC